MCVCVQKKRAEKARSELTKESSKKAVEERQAELQEKKWKQKAEEKVSLVPVHSCQHIGLRKHGPLQKFKQLDARNVHGRVLHHGAGMARGG